ncbi:MAG: glycosyltransferase family 2 protein [Candidatus Omnitrophica bacterium]|nr:glycosyltransferase family 2 protein [Candidatus Omnitrophota bacterium]
MKLSIIIPAYNEEQSIGSTIERALKAKPDIIKNTGIEDVEVVVVNDGSNDNTEHIAAQYKDVVLVSYENNKGYGAAIKRGFEKASGDLLSFLDADGTCDPGLFTDLVNTLIRNNADIVIGSRLGPGSKMPKVRRIGNVIFAKMINYFGDTSIVDCASGMRVLRRSAIAKLYPLPDGLHFTPAMTCRATMGGTLKIVETPIEYAEREGKSKLSVIKDGLRFLKIILQMALRYKPFKVLLTLALAVWIAMWMSLNIRELVAKGNLRDYNVLAHRSLEGKRAYVTGDRLYGFLAFCNDKLPEGATYRWVKTDKPDHARRRATYYLYPHLESEDADLVLIFDVPFSDRYGYELFAKLDDTRYILKKKMKGI